MGALFAIAGLGGLAWFLYSASQNSASDTTCPTQVCPGPLASGVQFNVSSALSVKQIAQFAQNAGFSPDVLSVAVAIALAESAGHPDAYNPERAAGAPQGQGSYGLWQIFLAKHPEFSGQNLYDPQTNASAALSVYVAAGNSFNPWATYTTTNPSLSYSRFMPVANDAVASLGSPAPAPVQAICEAPTCCGVGSTE